MKASLPAIVVVCLWIAGPAPAEMLKYTDSRGRLHFTQDISQVPPEYRHQVQKQELDREISVTGEGGGAESQPDRIRAMQDRSKRLQQQTRQAQPRVAPRPPKPRNRWVGEPAPKKYHRTCWYEGGKRKCNKTLTAAWQAWDEANGGDNGKPVTRRKVGDE